MARGRKRGLIDLHVPSSPPTDTCIPQNNHSTSNTISFLAVSDLLRLFPAVSGHILTFSRALEQSDAGVTAEYGPARAQKNQTGKWYPQIPVDHTTLQINQRVVNTSDSTGRGRGTSCVGPGCPGRVKYYPGRSRRFSQTLTRGGPRRPERPESARRRPESS